MNLAIERYLFVRRRAAFPRSSRLVLHTGAGAGVALLAWYPGHWLVALLILPWLWARAPSRWLAAALWSGYYLAAARDIPLMCERFFTGYGELSITAAWGLGVAFWLAQAALLAAPWVVLRTSSTSAGSLAWRAVLATALVTAPPLGVIGWVSPLYVASALYPGWGAWGVVFGAGALGVVGAVARRPRITGWLVPLALAAGAANARYAPSAAPAGWQVVNLRLGRLDQSSFASIYARNRAVIHATSTALSNGARVVILPEEIVGLWRQAVAYWWQPIAAAARAHDQTILVGADVVTQTTPLRYTDSVLTLGEKSRRMNSRMPMPAGLWRPGAAVSAQLGRLDQPDLSVDGKRMALSICFEDMLWWPHWRLLVDRPDVLVSVDNAWFDADLAVARIQAQSIASVARAAGAPLLRAVNR